MEPDENYTRVDLSSPSLESMKNVGKAIMFRQGKTFPLSYENGIFRTTALIPTGKKGEIKEVAKKYDTYFNEITRYLEDYFERKIMGD